MEIVSCTPEDLAAAFAEWERRYRAAGPECSGPGEQTPEEYGVACAPYFRRLLKESGLMSGDPLRRALALGWTPPAAGYEPVWFHPEHGPVHEEDLPGVLAEEAESMTEDDFEEEQTSEAGAATPAPDERPSPRPGTRMLELPPAAGDPMRQAAESVERLRRGHHPTGRRGAIGAPRPKLSRVLSDEEN